MNTVLALAVAATAPQDPDVAGLVEALAAEDVETRDRAMEALMRLGSAAEPLVVAALARTSDPEVKERLRAVQQTFVHAREEEFALARIREAKPFPAPRKSVEEGAEVKHGTSIADGVAFIAETFGIPVELYPGDEGLARQAKETTLHGGVRSISVENLLFSTVSKQCDLTYVIDDDRVVVVRLTPAVLFERLDRDGRDRDTFHDEEQIKRFSMPRYRDHWTSMNRFLQMTNGDARTRWAAVLAAAARDAQAGAEYRCRAIRAMRMLYGVEETLQPDTTSVFVRLAADTTAPAGVRAEAAAALAECQEDEGIDALLAVLEGDARDRQSALLMSLAGSAHRGLEALPRIVENDDRRTRLHKALGRLSSCDDREVAARAVALRVLLEDADAISALLDLPVTANSKTSWTIIEALRVTASSNLASVQKRIDALAGDGSAELRAAAALIYGRRAGGKDRGHDVEEAIKLLEDPEPVVRWAAARSLGTTYSRSASEPYDENLDACRRKLGDALQRESDARVRSTMETALKDLP